MVKLIILIIGIINMEFITKRVIVTVKMLFNFKSIFLIVTEISLGDRRVVGWQFFLTPFINIEVERG
jgi:hypothetical protein